MNDEFDVRRALLALAGHSADPAVLRVIEHAVLRVREAQAAAHRASDAAANAIAAGQPSLGARPLALQSVAVVTNALTSIRDVEAFATRLQQAKGTDAGLARMDPVGSA
jgi:hypothetical protein